MKDTVSLIKKNGEKTDGIKANVQSERILMQINDVLIETGDLIHREMPTGEVEIYEITGSSFGDVLGRLSGNYNIKKLTRHAASLAKDSESLESVDIKETQNMIKIFISHSSKDKEFVEKLIELVKNALHLRASEIRCTSIVGYGLPGGANTSAQIKSEVISSKAFIGVISHAAIDSMYVLFELGARWGVDRHLLPLLAPGVSLGVLKKPLDDLIALNCDSAPKLQQLVNDLAKELGIKPEESHTYQCYIDAILTLPPSEDKKSSINDSLIFDPKTGTYTSKKNNHRYCCKCFKSTPPNEVPLKEREDGWHCSVCNQFYDNPNYYPPELEIEGYDLT